MVKPVGSSTNSTLPQPILEKVEYSKIKVALIFMTAIPMMAIWAALVVICLPLKLYNCIQSCRGRNQIQAINALINEFFTILNMMIRYPCSTKKYHYTPGVGKPILLVHGYLHNASTWYNMIDRLKEKELGPIYAIDLGDGTVSGKFWSMTQYAQQVFEKTQQIATETGRADIAIVGHSMGGIIAMKAANLMPPNTLTHIGTIGSPLLGAKISGCIVNGLNGIEMCFGSEFMKAFEAEAIAEGIDVKHIASANDQLVSHKSALIGKKPGSNVLLEGIGHGGLATSDEVADIVGEWLSGVNSKTGSSQ